MALRKVYTEVIIDDSESYGSVEVTTLPFSISLDNGTVKITQQGVNIYLTYNMVAKLYGIVFPSQSFKCDPETGCAVEIPNHGTLNIEEKMLMWERFPEIRPDDYISIIARETKV